MQLNQLSYAIIKAAITVHRKSGPCVRFADETVLPNGSIGLNVGSPLPTGEGSRIQASHALRIYALVSSGLGWRGTLNSEQWWQHARPKYALFISELVLIEASRGDKDAAERRLASLEDIPELVIDEETQGLAERFVAEGCMPPLAGADALHVAVATVHGIDYLLTWNCRHIDNAATKPILRSICAVAGYRCPEICTPMELMPEDTYDVP